ncbi:hypothetical protein EVAR_52351_1 [Eumeta japonica]|uniref:Uncharacterized protein n=1 Tax=Eumeta variegata TaxID=151549 RepID=A0A4C1YVC9_EUMVA|nr:hypothetical protein EVAR_52351_1 [Eumeta japonica]
MSHENGVDAKGTRSYDCYRCVKRLCTASTPHRGRHAAERPAAAQRWTACAADRARPVASYRVAGGGVRGTHATGIQQIERPTRRRGGRGGGRGEARRASEATGWARRFYRHRRI